MGRRSRLLKKRNISGHMNSPHVVDRGFLNGNTLRALLQPTSAKSRAKWVPQRTKDIRLSDRRKGARPQNVPKPSKQRIVIPFQKSTGKLNLYAATSLSVSWTLTKAITKYRWQNRMKRKWLSTPAMEYTAIPKCPSASRTLAPHTSGWWTKLLTTKLTIKVQSLNGKLASLNRFLSKSAEKSLPLFKTLKKCIKKSDFRWTPKAEQALSTEAALGRTTHAGSTQSKGGIDCIHRTGRKSRPINHGFKPASAVDTLSRMDHSVDGSVPMLNTDKPGGNGRRWECAMYTPKKIRLVRDQIGLGGRNQGPLGEVNKIDKELPNRPLGTSHTIKSSHGDTLFSFTYGTEVVILAEIGMPTYRIVAMDAAHNDTNLRLNLDLLEERRERAAIRKAKAKLQMTKCYNARV
ncbi:hypothetical protein Tco_0341199 [Tanacetum coccineum]